jgi:hypothetical protein
VRPMEAIAAKIQDGKTTMIKVTGEQALIEGQSGKCMNHSCDVGEGQLGIAEAAKRRRQWYIQRLGLSSEHTEPSHSRHRSVDLQQLACDDA